MQPAMPETGEIVLPAREGSPLLPPPTILDQRGMENEMRVADLSGGGFLAGSRRFLASLLGGSGST
jgi:hypothetical protein